LGGGPLQEQHFDRRTACCAFSSSASITAWRGCIAALSAASSVEASIARGVWGVVSPTRISASAKTSPGPSTSVVLSFRRPLGHFMRRAASATIAGVIFNRVAASRYVSQVAPGTSMICPTMLLYPCRKNARHRRG
jgi:hypothetical protein